MPDFGSGIGDPIVPGPVPPDTYISEWCIGAVSPADYCRIIGYPECGFFGVRNDDDIAAGCREIWSRWQREQVARYLCEAQEELEQILNFPLAKTWYGMEPHRYTIPVVTRWGKVIAGGVRGESEIEWDAVMDHSADPARVTVATTVTDEDEIKVFYPDSTQEIIPNRIVISGGSATIYIPRCRMVRSDLLDTPADGLDYENITNFQQTVDVTRVYNDDSTQAELVDPHNCSTGCASGGCTEYTHTGCIYVRQPEMGILDILPASYSGGAWTRSSCSRRFSISRLNYYAGADPITKQMQDAIVRLAHSKMPQEPCACDPVSQLWARDRNVPDQMTEERANCPFGLSDGAWTAWNFARSARLLKMGVI